MMGLGHGSAKQNAKTRNACEDMQMQVPIIYADRSYVFFLTSKASNEE